MIGSREGNCKSGVTPAMHRRLGGLSTYGLNGLDRETSTVVTPKGHGTLYF